MAARGTLLTPGHCVVYTQIYNSRDDVKLPGDLRADDIEVTVLHTLSPTGSNNC